MVATPETDTVPASIEVPEMTEFTPEEAQADFAYKTRMSLGIEPEEFFQRLNAGEYNDIIDDPENDIIYLMILGRGLF